MFCKPAYTYSTVETTPRNATAHTAAHVACQISGALANLPERAEEFWSVSPLPSGTILPCVFSQLISCHVKKTKKREEKERMESSYKCVLNLLRERQRPSFRQWAANRQAAGTYIWRYSMCVRVCVCDCHVLSLQTKQKQSEHFFRSENVRGTLPTTLQKWSTSMDNLDSPLCLLAEE